MRSRLTLGGAALVLVLTAACAGGDQAGSSGSSSPITEMVPSGSASLNPPGVERFSFEETKRWDLVTRDPDLVAVGEYLEAASSSDSSRRRATVCDDVDMASRPRVDVGLAVDTFKTNGSSPRDASFELVLDHETYHDATARLADSAEGPRGRCVKCFELVDDSGGPAAMHESLGIDC